ncbi:MAG TPA: 3-deoxy-manno-octulosonate cytidylyltransferase [Gemmatimonadales bacterium]
MPVLAVIPARLGSTRLPKKPLQLLAGEPLVVRVAEHVQAMAVADWVVVATDAAEVAQVVLRAGFRALLTSRRHESGTDRVAEVASRAEFQNCDVVLNIQGDEPFLPREAVTGALDRLGLGDEVGTAAVPLQAAAAADPGKVKVVTELSGRALYFSRAPIPSVRNGGSAPGLVHWQHLGLYAFTREALFRWAALPPAPLEVVERLEQLRALQHGMRIGVARLDCPAPPGVDTPDDLREAEAYWHLTHEGRGAR